MGGQKVINHGTMDYYLKKIVSFNIIMISGSMETICSFGGYRFNYCFSFNCTLFLALREIKKFFFNNLLL